MQKNGFTLIELLVVVAIIGILAAVGVTTFNGFQEKSKTSVIKSTCKDVEKFLIFETTKCNAGFTDYIFGQKNSIYYQCPLSDPQYGQEGRIARGAFMNYVGYSRCSFCTMMNPFKPKSNIINFGNWGRINDNHLGFIWVSDTDAGANIDLYCCHTTPCQDKANHTRKKITP